MRLRRNSRIVLQMRPQRAVAVCAFISVAVLVWINKAPAATKTPFFSGLEGDRGETADGWRRDNYGDNITQFSLDKVNPRSGAACQRMSCLRWHSGSAQILSPRFKVLKDTNYVVRVWLRAESLEPERSVALVLRTSGTQDGVPLAGQMPPAKWGAHDQRRCSVPKQWQEFALNVKAAADCDAEISIGYESLGTLWIDDLSVTEGRVDREWTAAPAAKEPPRKGNLLYNGSFETGTCGWGPLLWEPLDNANRGRRLKGSAEKTEAIHGEHALRVDSTEWIESEYIQLRPGHPITLSAWMKADKMPMNVQLSFLDGSMIRYCEFASFATNCALTTEWNRFSVTGGLPASANNGIVVRLWGSSGVFWVDGVQVEEGDLTTFQTGGKVELGLTRKNKASGVYRPDEPCSAAVRAHGPPDRVLKIEHRLEDYHGVVRKKWRTDVRLNARGNGALDFEVNLPAPGIYRLVSHCAGVNRSAELILAQVKQAAAPYGGIHAGLDTASLAFVKDAGFGWWRLHDFYNALRWEHAELKRGEYLYDDEGVNRILATGAKILACLEGGPAWAAGRDPKAVGVAATDNYGAFEIEDWKNYVRAMVRHYKDRIHHWEIWNEPSGMPPAEYFKLLKEAYTVIKAEDAEALVVGGGGLHYYADDYEKTLFSLGGLQYMDAYSYHGYLLDGMDPWKFGDGLVELMKKHGKIVPFWDTEWGLSCNTFRRCSHYGGQSTLRWPTYPFRPSANLVMRHEIAGRALGVKANFWYPLGPYGPSRNNEGGLCVLVEYDGSPRASAVALANSWNLLGQADPVEMRQPNEIVRLYTFKHPQGTLFAADAKLPEGIAAKLVLPVSGKAEGINVMGESEPLRAVDGKLIVPISDEPAIVLFRDAKPDEIAGAARKAQFQELLPAELAKLLTISAKNNAPAAIRDAFYKKELSLGFELRGWLFEKSGKPLLVFVGEGNPGRNHLIARSHANLKITDSLDKEVSFDEKGRAVIANGAPYVAVGDKVEAGIKDMGPL